MSLIVAQGLVQSWSDVDVLKNVSVTVSARDRVGLVGPNGEGKTTLIRILAALLTPVEGTVQRKGDLRIGYLPQATEALQGQTLHETMLDVFANVRQLEQDLHELAHQMEQHAPTSRELNRYGQLQHDLETLGGYTYTNRIEQVLTGLRFDREVWDQPISQLSGGQQMRAKLARVLLEDPDVLLLDEPTNHMDLESVEWLQEWLGSYRGAMVVISHDRYFLDHVTTRTWELAGAALEHYSGNYTHYLTQREERFTERVRRWQAQQEYIRETEEFIRRFLAGQRSSEAKGRRTRLERFLKTEAIPRPTEHPHIDIRFKVTERTGDKISQLTDLHVGYDADAPLVTIDELTIRRGQRIAIVGPNGCGKTTLLKTLLGHLPALAGEVAMGSKVRIGYLSQTHAEWDPAMAAVDAVRQIDRAAISEEHARNLLGSLLLTGDDAFKQIRELSCGQQSRVFLARLMLDRCNVLFLDEPTNHLDINSREILQEVLSEFDGTIVFVSHDRYLIDALATDVWAIHDQTITTLHGDWERYLTWREAVLARSTHADTTPTAKTKAERKKAYQNRREEERLRRRKNNDAKKRQRRIEELEELIHTTENALTALNESISSASLEGDLDRVAELGDDYAAKNTHLQDLYVEWEHLSEIDES